MEGIPLSTSQLTFLASKDKFIKKIFKTTCASDELPTSVDQQSKAGYIVNIDRKNKPGSHWIALVTEKRNATCWILDSTGKSIDAYKNCPIGAWVKKHFKIVHSNAGRELQAVGSDSCGHYALFFLKSMSKGKSKDHFLSHFSRRNFVANDHKVGIWLKKMIKRDISKMKRLEKITNQQGVLKSVKRHHDLLK